jgi:hypothetical protein
LLQGSSFCHDEASSAVSSLQNTPARQQKTARTLTMLSVAAAAGNAQRSSSSDAITLAAMIDDVAVANDVFCSSAANAAERFDGSDKYPISSAMVQQQQSKRSSAAAMTTVRMKDGLSILNGGSVVASLSGSKQPPQWQRPYVTREAECVSEMAAFMPLVTKQKK